MTEEDRLTLLKPDNWEFFTQPPAVLDDFNDAGELMGYNLNPTRENAKYTDATYYTDLLHGQTRDWIRNMLQNNIGRIFSGRPVYRGFSEKTHVALEPFGPVEGEPIHIGVDFGLTPAAAFGQDVRGRVRVFDEIVTKDTNAKQFATILSNHVKEHYENYRIVITGDPRGEDRATTDSTTPYQIFKAAGLDVQPAWSNDPIIRVGAVETQLNTLIEGMPAYFLSPNCHYIVNAKKGGYSYLKDREEIDKKSIYSHISDAEQYMFLRMGYGKKLIGRSIHAKTQTQAHRKQNLFGRRSAMTAKQQNRQSILSRGR